MQAAQTSHAVSSPELKIWQTTTSYSSSRPRAPPSSRHPSRCASTSSRVPRPPALISRRRNGPITLCQHLAPQHLVRPRAHRRLAPYHFPTRGKDGVRPVSGGHPAGRRHRWKLLRRTRRVGRHAREDRAWRRIHPPVLAARTAEGPSSMPVTRTGRRRAGMALHHRHRDRG